MLDAGAARDNIQRYEEIMRRAYTDEEYRARLLADPSGVMREAGFEIPAGLEVRAVESTDTVLYLALPPKPSDELADEQLEQVTGGATAGTVGCAGTLSSLPTAPSFSCASTVGTAGTAG